MESIRSGPSEGSSLAGGPQRRPPDEDVAHRRALRLTFAYRGADVELVLMEAIDMIVPPSLDLGDQPPGSAFCIFFGPTPSSRGDEIRPASAVNVFGRVLGDPTVFKSVRSGTKVLVERA